MNQQEKSVKINCSVENCLKPARAKGLCHNHYEKTRLVINRNNQRKWTAKHRERRRLRHAEWKRKNPATRNESNRRYRERNRDKIRSRYSTDVNFRLASVLRSRMNEAIRVPVGYKNRFSRSLLSRETLGCDIPFLREHLESLFKEGMNWDNHGIRGWHIDHIKPCAKFNLTDPEQRKLCFHYTNLQPLWWRENCSKSARCP